MSIPCSYNSDVDRFIEFYEKSIENKTIKNYKIFKTSKNKICELVDESEELKEM